MERARNGGQSVNLERFVNVTAAERRPRIEGRQRLLIHSPLYPPPPHCPPTHFPFVFKMFASPDEQRAKLFLCFRLSTFCSLCFLFFFLYFFFLVLHSATISLSAWQALSRGEGRYEEEGERESKETHFLLGKVYEEAALATRETHSGKQGEQGERKGGGAVGDIDKDSSSSGEVYEETVTA